MTCNDARLLLAIRRPGGHDFLPEDAAQLERHLAGCTECTTVAASGSAFNAAVTRAMADVPVPAGLKASLHAAIGRTVSTNRWRRIGRTGLLAAALLAAVGLGFSIYAANRPALNLESLALRHDIDGREHEVKSWLTANQLPTALPYDFDFSLCTSHGFTEVQGRSVPFLQFQDPLKDPRNPAGFAKVLILQEGKFNLKSTPDHAGSSFVTALKVSGAPTAPGFTFIILHTGDIGRFLRPTVPQG